MEQPVKYAGHIKLTLFVEMNVPDTDLGMVLEEIKPDGRRIYLAHDFFRTRYWKSLSKADLIKPERIYKFVLDRSYFSARVIEEGSRLRLWISSLNSPAYEKNYNAGGRVAHESGKDARKAVVKVHHSRDYPSSIEFPIYRK